MIALMFVPTDEHLKIHFVLIIHSFMCLISILVLCIFIITYGVFQAMNPYNRFR